MLFMPLHSGSNRAKAGQNSNSSTPMKHLKVYVRGKRKFPDKESVSFTTVWFDLLPVQAHKQNVFMQGVGRYFVHEFQ
jgi:hypothetical protein